MKDKGLIARKKRAFKVVRLEEQITEDVHERVFKIENEKDLVVNEVWAGDVTYLLVDNKFLYLSVVMELRRRKVLGWSHDATLGSKGVMKASVRLTLKKDRYKVKSFILVKVFSTRA